MQGIGTSSTPADEGPREGGAVVGDIGRGERLGRGRGERVGGRAVQSELPLFEREGGGDGPIGLGVTARLQRLELPRHASCCPRACLPRQDSVSSLGAVSAKAPQTMHQKVGSLTTMQCFLPAVPGAKVDSSALAVQVDVAEPWQDCGASLLQVIVFALHSVHHQPAPRRSSEWPPSLGFLALTVLLLPVCGLTSVGRVLVCSALCLRFTAAAAALDREA